MTAAQRDVLRRAAAATGPIKVHATTARILGERFSFLMPEGEGWVLTPQGRAHMAQERAEARHRDVERNLPYEARQWAERVMAWCEAHKRFKDTHWAAKHYARHVAGCDYAGVDPVLVGTWGDGAREWVEETVRATARILKDFDEAIATANARGVGVSVDYSPDEKIPRSRRDAAKAAAEGEVVSLRTYRERRPDRGGAA